MLEEAGKILHDNGHQFVHPGGPTRHNCNEITSLIRAALKGKCVDLGHVKRELFALCKQVNDSSVDF